MTASSASATDADLHTTLDQIPSMVRGLDVNVKFDSIISFEKTASTTIFDLLQIPLVHGWLADPCDTPMYEAVAHHYYNELVISAVRTPKPSRAEDNQK